MMLFRNISWCCFRDLLSYIWCCFGIFGDVASEISYLIYDVVSEYFVMLLPRSPILYMMLFRNNSWCWFRDLLSYIWCCFGISYPIRNTVRLAVYVVYTLYKYQYILSSQISFQWHLIDFLALSVIPFRYLLSIVLSVPPQFTSTDYRFSIFCPLCCLFFLNLHLLITVLVSFVHCVVCSSSIYVFWLPFWYLLSIVLSVLPQFTSSDYRFGIFCPLCCLFFLNLRLLITVLVSFVHCVVCSSSIYVFWLPFWYLFSIVLSVLPQFTSFDYRFGIFCPLCCLFFLNLRLLITVLVSFVHCVVCSSSIYVFWLPFWYLLSIVLSVLLQFTSSDYRFGIFCPLCCLFFLNLRLLITVLVSFVHCVVCSSSIYVFWLPYWYLLSIVLSVLPQFTSSGYRFGIFCPLCCLFFLNLHLLITVLVSFVHCVVCSSSIYVFWLPFWYLLSTVLSVLPQFTSSDYRFGIFCPLCCLFFLNLRLLITVLVSFVHCVVCSSSIYVFWLPFWYHLSIVLSVLPQFTSSDYRISIFCPLCCLFFLNLRLLITVLVSFVHCVVCSSSIYVFWLPFWYLLSIVLSVLPQFTSSDYRIGIFCPLCCLFFLNLRLLITVLVSFVHCVVCSSSIYIFWLPFWYLLSIVLSVLHQFTSSDYRFGIFCPLCCLFFLNLRLLITVLVSFVHCVVCSSSIYVFW